MSIAVYVLKGKRSSLSSILENVPGHRLIIFRLQNCA